MNLSTTTLDDFQLSSQSSNATIGEALEALCEEHAKHCPGGAIIAVAHKNNHDANPPSWSRIAVSRGGQTTCSSSNDEEDAVTDDSLFEIGSISKPFAGLLLAKLVAEGVVTLETPLNDLLPTDIADILLNGKLVTLRHLVTHAAGFLRGRPSDLWVTICHGVLATTQRKLSYTAFGWLPKSMSWTPPLAIPILPCKFWRMPQAELGMLPFQSFKKV